MPLLLRPAFVLVCGALWLAGCGSAVAPGDTGDGGADLLASVADASFGSDLRSPGADLSGDAGPLPLTDAAFDDGAADAGPFMDAGEGADLGPADLSVFIDAAPGEDLVASPVDASDAAALAPPDLAVPDLAAQKDLVAPDLAHPDLLGPALDAGCDANPIACHGIACNPGFGDCDGIAANGCETALNVDPNHCGACAVSCSGNNAFEQCVGGACSVLACMSGFADCNHLGADGCETATTADPANCGSCGRACPVVAHGALVCRMGTCALGACDVGFSNCDGNLANGCESDLNNAVTTCGSCTGLCNHPLHGAPVCVAAQCGLGACDMYFGDCDHVAANGCETTLVNDLANCGACGNACALPHATPYCGASKCQIAVCAAGYADCNKTPGDGCEIDLLTDASHCGACGTVCPLGQHCINAVCTP